MILKPVLRGLLTYVPVAERRIAKSTRGTNSARYCYSVWLRHLVKAHERGLLRGPAPDVVAELGPGDSLGIGLAALLSGVSRYVALDVVEYANPATNLAILDELIVLMRERAPVPDADELPDVKPYLGSYDFPHGVLTEAHLAAALAPARVASIRRALQHLNQAAYGVTISYRVPWHDARVIEPASVDMLYSQAVLEHVDDLATTYRAVASWIKPGGFVSHEIGLTSHRLTPEWNGHWAVSDAVWKLIRGRRPYLLNREPASTHVDMITRSGLRIVEQSRVHAPNTIRRDRLAPRFRDLSEDDLTTRALFVQAVRVPA